MCKYPPKEISGLVGYKTKMSKINKDTWAFAHDKCGRLWIKLGVIILIPTIIAQIPFIHYDEDTIGIVTIVIEAVQLAVLFGSIVLVEKAIKSTFNEQGKRIIDNELAK